MLGNGEPTVGSVQFRDQHQGISTPLQDLGDNMQIDFGLAAPGDAVEKKALVAIGLENPIDGLSLVGGELRWRVRGDRGPKERVAIDLHVFDDEIPLVDELA